MVLTVVLVAGMVYFVATANVAFALQLAAWRRRDRAARERTLRYSTAETIRIPVGSPLARALAGSAGVVDLDQARRARRAAPTWAEPSYASQG